MLEVPPDLAARLPLVLLGIALLASYLGLRTTLKLLGSANRGGVIAFVTTAMALTAAGLGRADLATHLPLAVAATALTLGVAFVLWLGPVKTPPNLAMVLPVAVACAAGYATGRVDALSLLAILLLGVVALRSFARPLDGLKPAWPLVVPVVLGGAVGALVALAGPGLDRWYGHATDAVVVSFLLAPVIVLPVAFECVIASKHNHPDPLRPLITASVACATVVPVLAVLALIARGLGTMDAPNVSAATPIGVMMLFFGSLVVAGVSLGVLKPGRLEAVALLIVYGAGLGATMLITHF
jgi:hypothetical protein